MPRKQKKFDDYEFSGIGLNEAEKKIAEQRFGNYRVAYPHLNKYSDLQLLEELVYQELQSERIKAKIGEIVSSDAVKDSKSNPSYLQKQLQETLDYTITFKEKLGLFGKQELLDAFQRILDIFKKFALWRSKNVDARKVTCPFCQEPFVLMIRTDKYDAKKYPFFQGKLLCNPYVHKLWKENRISKEEYAEIMGVSADFTEWLDKNWFEKQKSNPSC